jgi:hypothetical protein
MYLIMYIHGVHQNCTSLFSPYTNTGRVPTVCTSCQVPGRPFAIGVGDGERGFRYGKGLLFSQKNCSGSGGMDQRVTFRKGSKISLMTLEYCSPCYVVYGDNNQIFFCINIIIRDDI